MSSTMNQSPERTPRHSWGSWGFFPLHFHEAIDDIETHQKYLQLISLELTRREDAFEIKLRETAAQSGWSEEDVSHYYEAHREQWETLKYGFPSILRDSLFTSVFSLLESRLVAICKDIDNDLQITNPMPRDNIGRVIERVKEHLKTNLQINIGQYAGWERLIFYKQVRHCLIHADGQPNAMRSKQREELEKSIKKFGALGITGANPERSQFRILLSNRILEKQAIDIKSFFEELLQAFRHNSTPGLEKYWP